MVFGGVRVKDIKIYTKFFELIDILYLICRVIQYSIFVVSKMLSMNQMAIGELPA